MLEIIILYFLAKDIGKLARKKGLKPSTWQLYLVLGWIFAEMTGVVLGILFFGMNNLITVLLIAIGFALSSYYFLHSRLNKFPDALEDEIDNIGNNL